MIDDLCYYAKIKKEQVVKKGRGCKQSNQQH